MAHRITVLAIDDCFASNVVGMLDMFAVANLAAAQLDTSAQPLFKCQVGSRDGAPVRASNGYPITVDGPLATLAPAELVLIPAFGSPRADLHIQAVQRNADLLPWLREQYAHGATLAATCSGSFLLAEAGLLDARPATTSWWLASAFAERYTAVHLDVRALLTKADRLICAGSGMSHLDLALHLIERCAGRDLARICARYTLIESARRSQAPYIVLNHARTYDPLVVKAEKWIRANLRRDIGIDEIAAHVAVSPRTLARRFKQCTGDSPQAFVQKMRVETCKALLEGTRLRMDGILERIGYSDGSAFRRLFRKHTGMSPRDYRERFGIKD